MLVDIVLSDEDGVALMESIPTLSPRIPFILLGGSGEYDSNVMHKTFPILRKPFTAQQLMRGTKAAIARFYLDQRQSIN